MGAIGRAGRDSLVPLIQKLTEVRPVVLASLLGVASDVAIEEGDEILCGRVGAKSAWTRWRGRRALADTNLSLKLLRGQNALVRLLSGERPVVGDEIRMESRLLDPDPVVRGPASGAQKSAR